MKRFLGWAVVACGVGAALWWSFGRVSDEGALDALVAQAEGLYARNDHGASAQLYARAADQAEAAGDSRRALALRAQSGVCLKMDNRPAEARLVLLPALEGARAVGDLRTEGLALGNLARVEALLGNFDGAMERLDELARLADSIEDSRLQVQTLEQAAMLALDLNDLPGAYARIDQALAANRGNQGEDDRHQALLRQRALVMARDLDDEGALAVWMTAEAAPVSLANQALHRSELGLHEQAADLAREAAHLFEQEGDLRRPERDDALRLWLGEALRAGRFSEVGEHLERLRTAATDDRAWTPFLLLEARLALAIGEDARALAVLDEARARLTPGQGQEAAGWLMALTLGRLGQGAQAQVVLDSLPESLARLTLEGWLLQDEPPAEGLASDRLPRLFAPSPAADERSLRALAAVTPQTLPRLDWLALHLGLADAERLRSAGRGDLAEESVRQATAAALHWQFLLTRWQLLGEWPDEAEQRSLQPVLADWVAGRCPTHEALLAVLLGERVSYLVVATSSLGATTFGLPGAEDLDRHAGAVSAALRSPEVDAVAQASLRLCEQLLPTRARIDLAHRSRWNVLLPSGLASVPPALWVTAVPLPGQPIPWLVHERTFALLPHVLPPKSVAVSGSRSGWVRWAEPELNPGASVALAPLMEARFGREAFAAGPGRVSERGPLRTGAAVTVEALSAAVAQAEVLELSVPGLGGGRLGGLLLTPDRAAFRGDARAGLLPWHQLGRLDLPPFVLLDRTRFDPDDTSSGPGDAAAAAAAGGARWLVLSRWPVPAAVRDRLLSVVELGWEQGIDPAESLAEAQRTWLQGALESGRPELAHPRQWAGLMAWGAP